MNNQSKTAADLVEKNLGEILRPNKNKLQNISTGLRDFDKQFHGLQLGELVVVGGRPGMGKSQFLMTLCMNISAKHAVAFFSLDNAEDKLFVNMISCLTHIAKDRISFSKLSDDEKIEIADAANILSKRKIITNVSTDFEEKSLIEECKKLIAEHGIQVLFIDNLQFGKSKLYKAKQESSTNEIASTLSLLAKELNVCIVVSCQLSRVVETRGGTKRPYLNDLLNGGVLEATADKIIMLYRPEYYGQEVDENNQSVVGKVELNMAKNNFGIGNQTISIERDSEFTHYKNYNSRNISISDNYDPPAPWE